MQNEVGVADLSWIDRLGSRFIRTSLTLFVWILGVGGLGLEALKSLFRHDRSRSLREVISVVLSQIYFTGNQALVPVFGIGMSVGALVGFQNLLRDSFFASHLLVEKVFVWVVFREVAPLLTAFLVIARSCTAIAAEVSSMKVNREISGLKSVGIEVNEFIFFPRVAGGIFALTSLVIYFQFAALAGSAVVLKFAFDESLQQFIENLFSLFGAVDLVYLLVKTVLFGFGVFSIACFEGLSVRSSAHEVPQATIRAVVRSISYLFVMNTVVGIGFYFRELSQLIGVD